MSVTAIIPCFKHEGVVRRAVLSALKNGCRVIVVDDATPDRQLLLANLSDLPVVVYQNAENQGLAASRNRGIELSDSTFYIPLDADDVMEWNAVKELLKFSQNFDIVYGNMRMYGGQLLRPNQSIKKTDWENNNQIYGCSLVRKSLWEKIGGYTELREYYEDWTFWWKAALHDANFKYVDTVVYNYDNNPLGMCARLNMNREKNAQTVRDLVHDYARTHSLSLQ